MNASAQSRRNEYFIGEAVAIGNEICGQRISGIKGIPAWLGPTGYGTEASPLRITKLGPHLYGGTTGIALFLAALGHVTNSPKFRDLSLITIAPLRRKLQELIADPDRSACLQIPLGGLIGLGSFIYGFLKIGQWLEEPLIVREAHEITSLITQERISQDKRVRIQTGSAGTILVLLALHKVLPETNRNGKSPLDLAMECARHLLDIRVSYEGLPRAWPLSPGKPPLLGFSYGAAGICFALLRLNQVFHQPELLEAAHEGFTFIQSFYLPEQRTWRDMRAHFQSCFGESLEGTWRDWWASDVPTSVRQLEIQTASGGKGGVSQGRSAEFARDHLPHMWCHGATGIAMGRLGALDILGSPEVREEIRNGLASARASAFGQSFNNYPVDDLCCGHMGQVEALHYASGKLDDEEFQIAAHTLADRVIRSAKIRQGYRLSAARGSNAFSPALFQGYAGIGYTLLRLADPKALSCLLLLE